MTYLTAFLKPAGQNVAPSPSRVVGMSSVKWHLIGLWHFNELLQSLPRIDGYRIQGGSFGLRMSKELLNVPP